MNDLLKQALVYLEDPRLYESELQPRKRRETAQQHADRVSDAIQRNEDLRTLVEEVREALGE